MMRKPTTKETPMATPKPPARPVNAPQPAQRPAAAPAPQPAPQPAPPATAVAAEFQAAPSPYKFALRSGIPIPEKPKFGVETIYPYAIMEVGQSFFVPASESMKEPWKSLTSLSSRKTRDMWPKKFVTAKMQDDDETWGVMVWRDADNTEPLPDPVPRKKKGAASAEALEQEAIDGDTSNQPPPAPMFD